MKLPASLQKLVGKIVVRDAAKKDRGRVGLVFDWAAYTRGQIEGVMQHFDDCEDGDFRDLRDGAKLKAEWMPFVLWCPDGLDDALPAQVKKQDKGNAKAKLAAFSRGAIADFPQFQAMWFLHETGRVVALDVDGTFLPAKKAKALVDDWKKLKLREARVADLPGGDAEGA